MTEPTTPIIQGDPFAPRRGRGRGKLTLALVIGIAAGLAGGLFGRDRLLHLLGRHDHGGAPVQQAAARKQLWTCGMHPQVIQDKPGLCPICHMDLEPLKEGGTVGGGSSSMPAHPHAAGEVLSIDPVMVQNMGVRVTEVVRRPLTTTIRAVGYLAEPDPAQVDINLRVNGWVEKLHVDVEGAHVEKGAPLFDLYSPEVKVAIEELIAARRSREAAGEGGGARSRTVDLLYEAARRKLELWGLEPAQVEAFARLDAAPATVTFVSPITGHVTEKMIFKGSAVKAGDKVLRLADRSTMWLNAQVFERDLPHVKVGQKVTATVTARPDKPVQGEVVFIHPHVDEMTRAALVRAVLPNPDGFLRQNMYARMEITVPVAQDAVTVPLEAVLDTGTRQVAFVSTGGGTFEPRTLKLGTATPDGLVQVLAGVEPGEKVVVSGQFLLDSESRLREAIAKHVREKLLGPGAGPAAPADVAAAPATRPAPAVAKAWTKQVDAVFAAYLELSSKLGAKQELDTPIDVARLAESARTLALEAEGDDRLLAERVAATAAAAAGKSLDDQREAFKKVSDAVVALARAAAPSQAVAERLFVIHCPHYKGTWIQTTDRIANPYHGTKMKACGAVKETIETVQAN